MKAMMKLSLILVIGGMLIIVVGQLLPSPVNVFTMLIGAIVTAGSALTLSKEWEER